ncbi:MAG: TIM44-like domain-containing protein [Clostridia bacterium]|nr:TIM44-like domain-containing protein [Clostridia bacterium]MBR4261443.1 TIM44-like domain-containing protein [Clostridia bacterium]
MKKHLKTFAKIFIALGLTICLILTINSSKSHADAGYHSSYSGGSSHSSSSHSSSSSSRSYSSGSSYHSSGSSSGSSESSWAGVIIWLIIIIVIIVFTSKKGTTTTPSLVKLQSNAAAIAKLKELIPDFDDKKFLQDGYQMFLDVEDAWMNFELDKVHNIITDEMFNMYESQLSSMEIKGEQNIMNGFVLRDSAISNCVDQNDNVEVTAKYIIEFYDYIIEKESGKVLRGSKTNKLRMYYDFTFIMKNTDEKIDHCPNCGAPVEVNASGMCPYCNSKIVGENTSWVMSKKVCTRQVNL